MTARYPTLFDTWGELPSEPGAAAPNPDLTEWDLLVVNSSAGKDSQTALRLVCQRAEAAGVLDRVVVQYNDLGERVSWPSTRQADAELVAEGRDPYLVERYGDRPGTGELAELQARHYGVRFEVRSRAGGDLLDDIERRGKFPDAARRWCTSDHKRGPGQTLLTALVRELEMDRPARLLYVYGFRAEESDNRAKKTPHALNAAASNQTRRHVWDWYPIHHWTAEQVWADMKASGVPYAWPYDAGMRRLSCSFCVLASKGDLTNAARLRPGVARQYAEVEARIGHSFQQARTIASIITQAEAGR